MKEWQKKSAELTDREILAMLAEIFGVTASVDCGRERGEEA